MLKLLELERDYSMKKKHFFYMKTINTFHDKPSSDFMF